MIKLTTSGESHGRALTAIIEGLPSNLPVDAAEIDRYLALRQAGTGAVRGRRSKRTAFRSFRACAINSRSAAPSA